MKNEAYENQTILYYLSHLPKKILSLQGVENAPEFVLHELCDERCFNLSKAAFFVDSPDFNHLKGVAGFTRDEAYPHHETIWQEPSQFSQYMKQALFNQKVRSFSSSSIKKLASWQATVADIARTFDFNNPAYHVWDLKHDNHGFLIYEQNGRGLEGIDEHLTNSLYLFGFCPIF